MKIPQNLLNHIEAELEDLDYGAVTIQVSGKTMDVITEKRQRFQAQEPGKELDSEKERVYRKG